MTSCAPSRRRHRRRENRGRNPNLPGGRAERIELNAPTRKVMGQPISSVPALTQMKENITPVKNEEYKERGKIHGLNESLESTSRFPGKLRINQRINRVKKIRERRGEKRETSARADDDASNISQRLKDRLRVND